jgi:hypothetical protein
LSVIRNSIGSSIVTTWTSRVSAMSRISDASVDDFPDPVGPVISTSPWGRSISSRKTRGRPQSSNEGKSNGTRRKTAESVPRCMKTDVRKRLTPGTL